LGFWYVRDGKRGRRGAEEQRRWEKNSLKGVNSQKVWESFFE